MPACHKIQMKLSSVQPIPEGTGCGAGVGGGAELGVLINKFQKVIMNCLWLRLDRKLYCKAVKVTGATMRRGKRGEGRRGEEPAEDPEKIVEYSKISLLQTCAAARPV